MESTKVLQIWVNCSELLHRFNYWTRLVLSLIIHELLTHIVSIYFIIENDYILWFTVKTLSYSLLLSNLRNKRMIKISRIISFTLYCHSYPYFHSLKTMKIASHNESISAIIETTQKFPIIEKCHMVICCI